MFSRTCSRTSTKNTTKSNDLGDGGCQRICCYIVEFVCFYLEVFGEMISNMNMRYLFKFVYSCFFEYSRWVAKQTQTRNYICLIAWYRTCPPRHRYITLRQKSLHFMSFATKNMDAQSCQFPWKDRSVVCIPTCSFLVWNHPWDWYIHRTKFTTRNQPQKKKDENCAWMILPIVCIQPTTTVAHEMHGTVRITWPTFIFYF